MTGRTPWREPRPARGGAHRRAVRRLGRGQLPEPAVPHHRHRGRAVALRGHGPARRQHRRQLRDRGRRAERRLAAAHARARRDPQRARARQAGRDDHLHPRPLDGVRRRRHQLRGQRALARAVTLLLQPVEPSQRRDAAIPRSLAAVGADRRGRRARLVRGRPAAAATTTAAPPPPTLTATTADRRRRRVPRLPWPTYGADNARLRAVAAPGAAAAVPASLDVPRPRICSSSRPSSATAASSRRSSTAGSTRSTRRAAACAGATTRTAAAGRRRRSPTQLLFATFIGNAECQATSGGGELVAFSPADRPRPLATHDRPLRVVAARRRRHCSTSATRTDDVYAFAVRTGRLRWSFDTGAPIKASPSFAYGRIYIGNYAGEMLALDARTGRLDLAQRRATATSTRPRPSPPGASTSARSTVTSTRSRRATEPSSGASGPEATSTPRPPSGTASSSSAPTTTTSTRSRPAPARSAGRFTRGASISGAASVVDGLVYFSSFDHRTYALAAASGRLREEWPDGEYSPAVAGDGRLYLVGLGRIYALAPRAG